MVTVTINGNKYQAEEGQSMLQVALDNGIDIPHLCYHENLSTYGGCRLCLVEIDGKKTSNLVTSCTLPAMEGLSISTHTPAVNTARRQVMELILAQAPDAPYIQDLARELGVTNLRFDSSGNDSCIRCGLCVRVCAELVGVGAISFAHRGLDRDVEPPFAEEPASCIGCGACVSICPTECIKIEENGDLRTIDRWKRTVKMQPCASCGRLFIPQVQIDFVLQQTTSPPPEGWFDLCPDCRPEGQKG